MRYNDQPMIAPWCKSINWSVIRISCFTMLFTPLALRAVAEDFTDAIHAYLEHRIEAEKIRGGIVVGIVDDQGSRIVSYGILDNGTDQEVDGDTLFEIGSVGKTFTALLLQDMIERGQMKLHDPVTKYVPESVKMPMHVGKQITLHHLATHTSGLPGIPDNLDPKRADNPYADYTVEKMYAFLSGYRLTRDPGAQSDYSNLGMGLLGHVIALKAETDYESLVMDRICRALKMDSTQITLSPELKSRFATGHNKFGEAVPSWDVPTLAGAGAMRSTANDMLKYVSANLGLTPSSLTPLMERTHDTGLAWYAELDAQGTRIIGHGGGTAGCNAFAGFDKTRHRGVAVLSNTTGVLDTESLGKFLLLSEWNSDRRPKETKTDSQAYSSYAGRYQRLPDFAQRMFMMRQSLGGVPKAVTYIPVGICLAVLAILLWRAGGFRKRLLIVGCAVLGGGLLVVLIALVFSHVFGAPAEAGIGIRRERDRLFVQATGLRSSPIDELLPPIIGELLPQSESHFFERLSGTPIIFSRDAHGNVTGFTVHHRDKAFAYEKISDEPPSAPEPLKPHVTVNLDTNLLDPCAGRYQFSSNAVSPAGFTLAIRREGDQLLGQAYGEGVIQGAFEIYPESEATFFIRINGAKLTFIKNEQGEVTRVIHHLEGGSDIEGTKLKDD